MPSPRRYFSTQLAVCWLMLSLLSPLASADDRTWIGTGFEPLGDEPRTYDDFLDPKNWSPGMVPSSSDRAIFNDKGSRHAAKIGANTSVGQILVTDNNGDDTGNETFFWMANDLTVVEPTSHPLYRNAVEIGSSVSGRQATLTVFGGSNGGGRLTVQGKTVIGKEANTTGKLHLVDMNEWLHWGGTNGAAIFETREMMVGNKGVGFLELEDGSLLQTREVILGSAHGSVGRADVRTSSVWTNKDSSLYNSPDFIVGNAGNAYLDIFSGGTVSSTFSVIAAASTSTSAVTVDGAGSLWSNDQALSVGRRGNGTLDVQNGGRVSNHHGSVGVYWSATGSATIDGPGSTWTNSGELKIGHHGGTGFLDIKNGGYVFTDLRATIGATSGSKGTVTVDGAGSDWGISDQLRVGDGGRGTLNIQNDGDVSNTSGFLGAHAGADGTVNVIGAGSTWINMGHLLIGGQETSAGGTGTLTVSDGGHVYVAGTLKTWGGGTVILDGGTIYAGSIDQSLGTFQHYDGTLTFNGGTYTNSVGTFSLDSNAISKNAQFVLDNGANTSGIDGVHVGQNFNATLSVQDGSVFTNSGIGTIAYNGGSTGDATVTGNGSTWSNSHLYVGGSNSSAGGNGSLTVADGGLVTVANTAKIWSTGNANVQAGGTVSVTGALDNAGLIEIASGGTISAASVTNTGSMTNHGVLNGDILTHNGGLLSGTGTFNGVVTIGDGGFFSAGASPGTATMTDTVWDSNGTYTWEINALASNGGAEGTDAGWDLWNTGNLTINGPFNIALTTLDASNDAGLLAGWNDLGSYQWRIATATNGAFLDLSQLFFDFTGFQNVFDANFFSLTASGDGNELYLNYINPEADIVPEPGSIAAMLSLVLCAAGAAVRRRNRRRRENCVS